MISVGIILIDDNPAQKVPNNTRDISMDGNNCGIGFFNAFAIRPSVVSIQ